MSAYDKFYDTISRLHKATGKVPSVQDVMNDLNLKTESQDPDSIIRDDYDIYENIVDVLRDYKKLADGPGSLF